MNALAAESVSVSGSKKTVLLAGLQVALLLAAVEQTIISAAMPSIAAELQGMEFYSWTLTGYLFASCFATLAAGYLSDRFGRVAVMNLGLSVFGLASLFCGFVAGSPAEGTASGAGALLTLHPILQLVLLRIFQGAGAGAILASCFTIVGAAFKAADRGKYQGVFAAVFALAALAGPPLGGWIADAFSWRWLFWANVPLCMVAAILIRSGARDLPRTTTSGAVSFSWLELLRNRTVAISILSTAISGIAMYGSCLLIPFYLFEVCGFSASKIGLVLSPLVIVTAGASALAGLLIAKTKRYKVLAVQGWLAMFVGTSAFAAGVYLDWIWLLAAGVALGSIGLGATLPLYTIAVQAAVPREHLGATTSLTQFSRTMGGAIGSWAMGYLLLIGAMLSLNESDRAFLPGAPNMEQRYTMASQLSRENDQLQKVIASAYRTGTAESLIIFAFICVGVVAANMALSDVRLDASEPTPDGSVR